MLASMLLLAFVLPIAAADPPSPPLSPVVILPNGPPAPPTPPAPKVPTKLAADQVYLVRSSVACTLIDGTEGIISVASYTGPVTFAHTKFTDGSGYEDRTVTDKYVYAVTAVGTSKVDLIIAYTTPDMAKPAVAATQVVKIRVCLDVTGDGPPTPPTPPNPPAPTDPLTKALQAAYSLDTDADRAASLAYLQASYKGMAAQVPADKTTNAAIAAWMKTVVESPGNGITATQVVNLRKAIAAELLAAWGATTAPLNTADAAKEILKIATALSNLK